MEPNKPAEQSQKENMLGVMVFNYMLGTLDGMAINGIYFNQEEIASALEGTKEQFRVMMEARKEELEKEEAPDDSGQGISL